MHLHKEVNGTTWRLGLESCSNKDPTPLPNSIGTKRDASGWVWGFIFYEAIGYGPGQLLTGRWAAERMNNGIVEHQAGVADLWYLSTPLA